MSSIFAIFFAVVFVASLSQKVSATASTQMSIQGKIVVQTSGINIDSSSFSCIQGGADTCDFRASIYDGNTGTDTLLWREPHANVEIGDYEGIFNLKLNSVCASWTAPGGSCSGSGITWGSDSTMYIQIEVDRDGDGDFASGGADFVETFPASAANRPLLTSVPYAFYADDAGSVGGLAATNFVRFAPASVQTTTSTNSLINIQSTATSATNALVVVDENGSGTPALLDLKVATSSIFSIANSGAVTSVSTNQTGSAHGITANSLTTGNGLSISSSSTAGGGSGSSYLINLSRSGANSNASHTAYGISSSVTNTGTTSINIAGYFSASGATENYGLIVLNGRTGIGLVDPEATFHVGGASPIVYVGDHIVLDATSGESRIAERNRAFFIDLYNEDIYARTYNLDLATGGANTDIVLTPNRYTYFSTGNVGIGVSAPGSKLDIDRADLSSNSENLVLRTQAFTQTITGALANGRVNQILAPTFTAGSAQTVTTAATLYIDNQPQAAGSATISNAYALWIDDGKSRFDSTFSTNAALNSVAINMNQSGVNSNEVHALKNTTTLAPGSSNTLATAYGVTNLIDMTSAGTVTSTYANFSRIQNTSTGTMGTVDALRIAINNTSSGTISTGSGVRVTSGSNAGTFTTNYGIHVEDQTKGTSDYGLYIAGSDTYAIWVDADKSRFDGLVEIQTLGTADTLTSLCRNTSNEIATCSSSLRYKYNVNDLMLGLDEVLKMRPVTFNWNGSNIYDFGFIAEEVNGIDPLLTFNNQDGLIEGVRYMQMSALLVNAIKEQENKIIEIQLDVEDLVTVSSGLQNQINLLHPQNNELIAKVGNLESTIGVLSNEDLRINLRIDDLQSQFVNLDSKLNAINLSAGGLTMNEVLGYFNANSIQKLTVYELNITGNLTVENLITAKDIKVTETLTLGKDSAGQSIVEMGKDFAEVKFKKPFKSKPIITINPIGEDILSSNFKYSLVEDSAEGFKIKVSEILNKDIVFNWQVTLVE